MASRATYVHLTNTYTLVGDDNINVTVTQEEVFCVL